MAAAPSRSTRPNHASRAGAAVAATVAEVDTVEVAKCRLESSAASDDVWRNTGWPARNDGSKLCCAAVEAQWRFLHRTPDRGVGRYRARKGNEFFARMLDESPAETTGGQGACGSLLSCERFNNTVSQNGVRAARVIWPIARGPYGNKVAR